ncbi:E3 ubiquitin-protein ligase RNF14-like [Rhynchocyon petersi]
MAHKIWSKVQTPQLDNLGYAEKTWQIMGTGNTASDLPDDRIEYPICFLPPLVLNFKLPPDYPSSAPPLFTLSAKWLPPVQLSTLCKHLDRLWKEQCGEVVLFSWTQFLKENTLTYLNITSPFELRCPLRSKDGITTPQSLESEVHPTGATSSKEDQEEGQAEAIDDRAVQDVESLLSLLQEVLSFDQMQQKRSFEKKAYPCNICFSIKGGSECMRFLECKHVYCRECLKGYFEIQIMEGRIHSLNCPDPKCSSLASSYQVKELVSEELFARYDKLLFQSTLDSMGNVVVCPRPFCQLPVIEEPGSRMGICTSCNYAFCTLCRLVYHGVSPCKMTAEKLAQLCYEYGRADKAGKKFLEQKYGKRIIQMAIEETKSKAWLEQNSKCCPKCGTRIEKYDGCNKMTCIKCMQYFCWICLKCLSTVHPYKHFSDPTSRCFNQ